MSIFKMEILGYTLRNTENQYIYYNVYTNDWDFTEDKSNAIVSNMEYINSFLNEMNTKFSTKLYIEPIYNFIRV